MADSFVDIVIKVEDKSFPCHKFVLAGISPFFFAMFTDDFSEQNKSEIEVKSVSAEVFEGILKYVYAQEHRISPENVDQYLKAACCLQIEILQSRCEEVIKSNLSNTNIIGVWKLARFLNCTDLEKDVWSKLMESILEMGNEEEFKTLDKEDVLLILSNSYLQNGKGSSRRRRRSSEEEVKEENMEEKVLDLVAKWVEQDHHQRAPYWKDILPHIRFPLMSPGKLLSFLDTHPHLYIDKNCRTVFNEAQRFHMLPFKRHEIDSRRVELRSGADAADAFIIINGSESGVTYAYCFLKKSWYRRSRIPEELGEFYGSCKMGNDIYLSGGTMGGSTFLRYSSQTDEWNKLPQMPFSVLEHAMVSYKNDILVIGGVRRKEKKKGMSIGYGASQDIIAYSTHQKSWFPKGRLLTTVCRASALVLNDIVLVFGGKTDSDDATVMIQQFDLTTSQSTVIAHLHEPVAYTGAFIANEKIYLISAGSIFVLTYLDGSIDIVSVKQYENLDISIPSTVFYGGILHALCASESDVKKLVAIDMNSLDMTNEEEIHIPEDINKTGSWQMLRVSIPKKILGRRIE